MFWNIVTDLCVKNGVSPTRMCYDIGLSNAAASRWKNGAVPNNSTVYKISEYFGVSVDMLRERENTDGAKHTSVITFPVVGDIAAGYDNIAVEDWDGDKIDIPSSYLKGEKKENYFALRVKGDSMYPTYKEGDIILLHRQDTLDYSGQVAAVMYDDEYASLKRVEYKEGEFMRLIPANPSFPPEKISGERLTHAMILGVPRVMLREEE